MKKVLPEVRQAADTAKPRLKVLGKWPLLLKEDGNDAAVERSCYVCGLPSDSKGACDECRKLAVAALKRDPAAIAELAALAGRPTPAVREVMRRRPIDGRPRQTLQKRVAALGQQITPPVSWTLPEAHVRPLDMAPRFVR